MRRTTKTRGKVLLDAALTPTPSKPDASTKGFSSFLNILKRPPLQELSLNSVGPNQPKVSKTQSEKKTGPINNESITNAVIHPDVVISKELLQLDEVLSSVDVDSVPAQPLATSTVSSDLDASSFFLQPIASSSTSIIDASNLFTSEPPATSTPTQIFEPIPQMGETDGNQEDNNSESNKSIQITNNEETDERQETINNQENNKSEETVNGEILINNEEADKVQGADNSFDVKDNDLITFLNTTSDGKCIINYYKSNDFRLNGKKRGLLVDLIIRTELENDLNRRLTSYDFKKFAGAITQAFPREIFQTYYIPGIGRKKEKKPPGGKLYNKYTNLTKKYIQDGIRTKIHEEAVLVPVLFFNAGAISEEEYKVNVEWLNKSITPWAIVILKWKLTAPRRLFEYEQTKVPISEYLDLFPALKLSEGSELIGIDFAFKYEEHKNCFHEAWPHLKDALIAHTQRKIKDDPPFKATIKANKVDFAVSSNDEKDILALYCLLHLIPLGNPRKRSTDEATSIRLSRTEVINGFLLRIVTEGTLETAITERTEAFLAEGERCQAFLVISGSKPPYTFIVVFNNTRYFFKDLGSAVDSCFKTFMIFDVQYPRAALQCWTFIQRFIYNITTKHDIAESASLSTLAADLDLL